MDMRVPVVVMIGTTVGTSGTPVTLLRLVDMTGILVRLTITTSRTLLIPILWLLPAKAPIIPPRLHMTTTLSSLLFQSIVMAIILLGPTDTEGIHRRIRTPRTNPVLLRLRQLRRMGRTNGAVVRLLHEPIILTDRRLVIISTI